MRIRYLLASALLTIGPVHANDDISAQSYAAQNPTEEAIEEPLDEEFLNFLLNWKNTSEDNEEAMQLLDSIMDNDQSINEAKHEN